MLGKPVQFVLGAITTVGMFVGAPMAFGAVQDTVSTASFETAAAEMAQRGPVAKEYFDAALADELGITVSELEAAREAAFEDAVEAALADGAIDQEQADRMLAGKALRGVIDRDALMAEVLGVSVDEIEKAKAGWHAARVSRSQRSGAGRSAR